MTQDCQQVVEQAYLNVNVFLRTLVSIITTLAFMFSITEPLTFVAFVSVPAVVAISMKYSAIFRQISEEAQKSLADANAVANEGLGNMPDSQQQNVQPCPTFKQGSERERCKERNGSREVVSVE